MRSIFQFVLLSAVLALASSCSRFLGEDPKDSWGEEGILSSYDALRNNAVFSIYNHIGGFETSVGLQGTCRGVYDLNTMNYF